MTGTAPSIASAAAPPVLAAHLVDAWIGVLGAAAGVAAAAWPAWRTSRLAPLEAIHVG